MSCGKTPSFRSIALRWAEAGKGLQMVGLTHIQPAIRLLRETDGRWIGYIPELPGMTVEHTHPVELKILFTLRSKLTR